VHGLAQLAAIPSPFDARCFYVLVAALGGFPRVLGSPGLVVCCVPGRSFAVLRPIGPRRSDVFLAAFCGLLGVLLSLLTHALPSFVVPLCLLQGVGGRGKGRK
jgi:hypothetical protein